jgi:hypothetical protein
MWFVVVYGFCWLQEGGEMHEKRLVHLYLYLYGGHVLNVCGHVS